MDKMDRERLLKDKRVIDEINRHLWIESEKAGHNIGFEKAADDWLNRFSVEWLKFNNLPLEKPATPEVKPVNGAKPDVKNGNKRRSAKSYFK